QCLNNNIYNKTYMENDTLGIRIDRLLARSELAQKEERNILQHKSSDYRDNRRMKNGSDNIKTYNKLGKNNLNKLELYKKDYRKRYNKKNKIAKLECYCEKNVFDKFDHICILEENIKNGKKHLKKNLFKNYGLSIVLLSLFSLIGIIIPILDIYDKIHDMICPINGISSHDDCTTKAEYICGTNYVLFMPFYIILLLTSIYLFAKFLKYKRLKSGKTKMKNRPYI
ncbi:Plasmodium exported protein, unknown function, partial [Plasmodium vivax]